MVKLSDTHILILRAAAQRPDHIALPLPGSPGGGAAAKVVGAMLAKGFLQEADAPMRKGEPICARPATACSMRRVGSAIWATRLSRVVASAEPVRHEVVTHVLGTFCYPCLRAVHD